MRINLNTNSPADYALFLKIKSLPRYRFIGRTAEIPDEYAGSLGVTPPSGASGDYVPHPGLFDYQAGISGIAIRKRKYATFVEPGRGKTFIGSEFCRQARKCLPPDRRVLMIAPSMVVGQTMAEVERFYGGQLPVQRVRAAELSDWLTADTVPVGIGITNWEALKPDTPQGKLGALWADESSVMKSAYGTWGTTLIRMGRGVEWKLATTGTPAPNDRIEYASHAVFLDQCPTVNSFLARYFVNRGQTQNRWEMKPHALRPFYRGLSHWSIFMSDPAVYGWHDGAGPLPPIHIHVHEVPLTDEQANLAMDETGTLHGSAGGIGSRSVLSQISKGHHRGKNIASHKPAYIAGLIGSWPDESTLVWCLYNNEQDRLEKSLPGSASIRGATPLAERETIIAGFKAGRIKTLISKPEILGFGLNLQVATRQVFSGLEDSYEEFYQAVKRSNRVGSTRPLNVHIPVTRIERPMIDTVLQKAKRIEADTKEQEAMFKELGVFGTEVPCAAAA